MTQNEPAALENAEAIIERFGGIRPMATKINVPVTTVQGWKKRNVIPGTRRAEILRAAQQLGVDLSDVLSAKPAPSSVANENDRGSFAKMVEQQSPPSSTYAASPMPSSPKDLPRIPATNDPAFAAQLAQAERRAVNKSTLINLFLVILAIVSVVLLLLPQHERRLDSLESQLHRLEEKQSLLSSLIPDDIEAKIEALQVQFGKFQTGFGSSLGKARTVAEEVTSPTGGSITQRAQKIETAVNEITGGSTQLSSLVAKFESMAQSLPGQQQLGASTGQLLSMLSGVPTEDPAQVDAALQNAQSDPQLAQTFEGIPPQDLKAAAMLLSLTQFRSSLNRDNQPFAQDLALMKKLAGDDPELQASIDRLAPYAEQGVLTPSGLTSEFKGIAGDVVVASLEGEDVSIKEKAQARFGEMFQIEKNGEPVGGTPTQNTVAKADKMLQSGNLEGAIAQMQTLDGPALSAAQPWISKAQATVMAHKFKTMLNSAINKKGTGGVPVYNSSGPLPAARGLNLPGSPALIQDDETGINILRPSNSPPPTTP